VPDAGAGVSFYGSFQAASYYLVSSDPVAVGGICRPPSGSFPIEITGRNLRGSTIGTRIVQLGPTEGMIDGAVTAMESFFTMFTGIGAGQGVPYGGTFTLPFAPAAAHLIHFDSSYRTAAHFEGPGVVIDGGLSLGLGVAVQLHVFNAISVSEVEAVLRANPSYHWYEVLASDWPAVCLLAGLEFGFNAGVTLYGGHFHVYNSPERPPPPRRPRLPARALLGI
jgi:hypothetical protein